MMTFDPQKRLTPAQAIKHPYFEGFVLDTNNSKPAAQIAGNSNKNFFNAANDF